jgi:hypothetical protein
MYVLSLDEVKEMIIFCKQQKVKNLKLGEINIEMSDYSHIESLSEQEATPKKEETQSSKNLVDTNITEQAEDDSDMLFWSAGT